MNWKTCASLFAVLFFVLAFARDVRAQDKAAAEALFDEGRTLMQQKKYPEACDKFEKSQQIDPSVGTLLNLGSCFEKLNKLASAWTRFREAGNLAAKTGDPRANVAAEHARSLEPKVSRLTISVADAGKVDGLEVTRDGVKLSPALYGSPSPIDSGAHVIMATAPGKKQWKQEVKLAEAEAKAIAIPALEAEGAEGAEGGPAPVETKTTQPEGEKSTSVSTDKPPSKSNRKMLALVAGGIGVVGIGVGTFLGLSAKSKYNDAKAGCAGGTSGCTGPAKEQGDDAKSQANLATIAFGVGIVGLAAGAVLWFTAPKESTTTGMRSKKRVAVIPVVSPNSSGILLQGVLP